MSNYQSTPYMDQEVTIAEDTRRVIRISKKFLALSAIVIIVLAWIVLQLSFGTVSYGNNYGPSGGTPDMMGVSIDGGYESSGVAMPEYYNKSSDITDTREFMKTSYSAEIATRDVSKVVTDVKNIVKGADGRVDNISSSEKNGYISFVVAKSKFDALRDQIESLTGEKLYSENISSTNRLGTKQNIEDRTDNVVSNLDTLKKQQETLTAKHNQTVASINSELGRIRTELASVRANIAGATASTDSATLAAWKSQEQSLVSQETTQKQRLSSENSSYATQKQSLEAQIANQNSNLTNVQQHDTNFTNDIETVQGSVSVHWVSLWQLLDLYSPIAPGWIALILAGLIWAYLDHKKYTPKIVLS
jgi:hypothetical protein